MRKTFFSIIILFSTLNTFAQKVVSNVDLQLLSTRSWIRVALFPNSTLPAGSKLYWSTKNSKPQRPNRILDKEIQRYYIQNVKSETTYYIWLELATGDGTWKGKAYTHKKWELDAVELEEERNNPSSGAVPEGMEIYWQDEFNDDLLNLNKWSTNYFSSLNYLNKESRQEMLEDKLPQPAYTMDGRYINLYVNDTIPTRLYTRTGNQKISSIQTYDWRKNENLLDNSRGGYFEVKVRRNSKGNPKGLNTAFWFDAPGPDIRYYLQQGSEVDGVRGIRPKGQLFEIDVFEYLHAQFVIHGHVDKNGEFQRNLATHIAEGYEHIGQWVTHGVLWTPTSIKHYINGDLIKEYTEKNQIYSPNHFMNVFLGAYGSEGEVNMEVDYVRAYNWPLAGGNELPNPDFDSLPSLVPWEGNGKVEAGAGQKGSKGLVLKPEQYIEQYVYLDASARYDLQYWLKGKGDIQIDIAEVAPVTGNLHTIFSQKETLRGKEKRSSRHFKTKAEITPNTKIMHVRFENRGNEDIALDNIVLKKSK